MRRFLIAILCLLFLTTAVSAAGTVTNLQSSAVFASNGTCQVNMVLQLSVDSKDGNLRFPLPGNAKDITLNGSAAKTSRADSLRWVDLNDVVYGPGSYSITLHYSLPDMVRQDKTGLVLTLPLLSGFSYPVENMEFSITLPGTPTQEPQFSSTYHPESMESYLEYSVNGTVISGSFIQGLKDYETLTMTLPVTGKMFPQDLAKRWSMSYDDLFQYGLLLLAVVYWLIFLRCGFPRRVRRVQAPDGITAGELGCALGGLGVDFSMMVLSWAQMGYLTIEMDRHNRVLLRKTMDMGNERSEFEMRSFKTLFGKRDRVDGSSEHFARLGRKAGKTIPGAGHYFKRSSGNPLIFRCITAGIGAIAGYSLAIAFASDTVWQVLLAIVLIPFGGITSWLIQTGVRGIQLRYRTELLIGIVCLLLWVILGNWAGEGAVAMLVIISQVLAGIAGMHGGRRTEEGLQLRNEALGLRKYLSSITPEELERILEHNPEYYFAMAPYAIAFGVDKSFTRKFGTLPQTTCPYLLGNGGVTLNARQWNERLRQVIKVLDERQRQFPWEKLFRRK